MTILKEIFIKLENSDMEGDYVKTPEYLNWLIDFLDKHKTISNFAELYDYKKLEYATSTDINNIRLLSDFWRYIFPKDNKVGDEFLGFGLLPDVTNMKEISGKIYAFHRETGLGCYVYSIELVGE